MFYILDCKMLTVNFKGRPQMVSEHNMNVSNESGSKIIGCHLNDSDFKHTATFRSK